MGVIDPASADSGGPGREPITCSSADVSCNVASTDAGSIMVTNARAIGSDTARSRHCGCRQRPAVSAAPGALKMRAEDRRQAVAILLRTAEKLADRRDDFRDTAACSPIMCAHIARSGVILRALLGSLVYAAPARQRRSAQDWTTTAGFSDRIVLTKRWARDRRRITRPPSNLTFIGGSSFSLQCVQVTVLIDRIFHALVARRRNTLRNSIVPSLFTVTR